MANIFHVSGLANQVKRVLKTRVSIESRVFKTRDAIIINSFKTGQLTILLDAHCYLARGFHKTKLSTCVDPTHVGGNRNTLVHNINDKPQLLMKQKP